MEIVVALIVVVLLVSLGAAKYASTVQEARRNTCIDSQGVIDRTVRMWEHRNRDLPAGASITFDMNGDITDSSGLGSGPIPAGGDIRKLASTEDLFACPERIEQLGGRQALSESVRSGEKDFTWLRSALPDERLNNARIGTFCRHYVSTGPDLTADTRHR